MVAVDPYLAAAVGLLLLGVVGSVVPVLPGMVLSVVGVLLYWWSTGYGEPGTVFVGVTVVVGVAAVLVDVFAGAISARAGGASRFATGAAAVAGLVLFLFLGPLGIVVGVALAVFLVEFYRTRQFEGSATAALYATVGLLASAAVQFVLTLAVLLGFLVAVVW